MTGSQRSQLLLRDLSSVVLVLSVFCAIVGCESKPPPPSGLNEWIDETRDNAAAAKSDDDVEKPELSKDGPYPKAVVPEADFQFGQMRVGTHMQHEFKIINEGEASLRLVAGKPTCKCTQFKVSPSNVPPGESAVLTVEWHGKSETTTFQHGGKVYTNDPNLRSIRFNVGGTVDATVVTQPEGAWNAGELMGKDPITFEGTIASRFLPDLTVSECTNSSDFVSVEHEALTTAQLASTDFQSGLKFRITIKPGFPVGPLEDTLIVKLAELDETIDVPVIAQRLGDVRFIPMRGTSLNANTRTLRLGQFPASRGRSGEFMLMVNGTVFADELEILETESTPKSLKIHMEQVGKPNNVSARYKVVVEVPPGGLRAEYTADNPAMIRCRTNHPTEQEIVIGLIYNTF